MKKKDYALCVGSISNDFTIYNMKKKKENIWQVLWMIQ